MSRFYLFFIVILIAEGLRILIIPSIRYNHIIHHNHLPYIQSTLSSLSGIASVTIILAASGASSSVISHHCSVKYEDLSTQSINHDKAYFHDLANTCTAYIINGTAIHNETSSNESLASNFYINVRDMVTSEGLAPDILWTYGESSAYELLTIMSSNGSSIPMIVTIFQPHHHNHHHASGMLPPSSTINSSLTYMYIQKPHVWYYFISSDMRNNAISHDNQHWLEGKSFISLSDKHKSKQSVLSPINSFASSLVPSTSKSQATSDADQMLDISLCLIAQLNVSNDTKSSLCQSISANEPKSQNQPDDPITIIGKVSYSRYNMSQQYLGLNIKHPLIVGSLTTTPKRLAEFAGPLSDSIVRLLSISQLDRVYINIPWQYSLRISSGNVELPLALVNMMTNESIVRSIGRLRVIRCKDWGPSTKLLPVLLLSHDDLPLSSSIITFDDDRLYTKENVAALVLTSIAYPNAVITNAAWSIRILSSRGKRGIRGGPDFHSMIPMGKEGEQYRIAGPVDLILGFYGVLYRKAFFDPIPSEMFNYTASVLVQNHCSMVDDIWFSGQLERMSIPRRTFGRVPNTGADITSLTNVGALSLEGSNESDRQNRDNVYCAEAMRKLYGIWTKPS